MEYDHALSALTRKYALTLGELRRAPSSNKLSDDLAHLEAVIQMFDPAWTGASVQPIQPKAAIRWTKRGLGMRAAIDVLRKAQRPMTVREIALAVIRRHGVEEDPETIHSVCTTVRDMLKRRVGNGMVKHPNKPVRWALAR